MINCLLCKSARELLETAQGDPWPLPWPAVPTASLLPEAHPWAGAAPTGSGEVRGSSAVTDVAHSTTCMAAFGGLDKGN